MSEPQVHPSIWESIDRLMSLEVRNVNAGMLPPLYEASIAIGRLP